MKRKCYPKTYRLPLHEMDTGLGFKKLPDKYYMALYDVEQLLGRGVKYIREKFDGTSKDFIVKYRGCEYQVFSEDLTEQLTIPYGSKKSESLVYAVWNVRENDWLRMPEFIELSAEHGWMTPPILHMTVEAIDIKTLLNLLDRTSAFNPEHKLEGIVIINDTMRMEGKIINPEYDDNVR